MKLESSLQFSQKKKVIESYPELGESTVHLHDLFL
jgi:hypothetical protein